MALKRITDRNLVHPIIEVNCHEYYNPTLYNTELIQLLINTLIVIIARKYFLNIFRGKHQQTIRTEKHIHFWNIFRLISMNLKN